MTEPKYKLGQNLLIRHKGENVNCKIVERVLNIDIDTKIETIMYGYIIKNSNLMYQSKEDTLTLYRDTALLFKE